MELIMMHYVQNVISIEAGRNLGTEPGANFIIFALKAKISQIFAKSSH